MLVPAPSFVVLINLVCFVQRKEIEEELARREEEEKKLRKLKREEKDAMFLTGKYSCFKIMIFYAIYTSGEVMFSCTFYISFDFYKLCACDRRAKTSPLFQKGHGGVQAAPHLKKKTPRSTAVLSKSSLPGRFLVLSTGDVAQVSEPGISTSG